MTGYLPIEDGNGPLIRAMAEPRIPHRRADRDRGRVFHRRGDGRSSIRAIPISSTMRRIPTGPEPPSVPWSPRFAFAVTPGKVRSAASPATNLRGNGAILRQTVVELARLSDPGLADWIDAEAAFPNSMVDSIVPATGPAELSLVREMGIDDAAPVTHENFRQWVIEDAFCAGRPRLGPRGRDLHRRRAMAMR